MIPCTPPSWTAPLAIDDSYDADVKPAVTTITVDYQS